MNAAYPGLIDVLVHDMRGEAGTVVGWEDGYLVCLMGTGKLARLDPFLITVVAPAEVAPEGEPS